MQRIRRKHLRKKSKKCCLANKIVISAAGTLVFVDDVDDGHEDVDVDDGALRTKCSINISRRNKASCFPHSDKLSWQQSKIYVITSRHSQRLRKLSAMILGFLSCTSRSTYCWTHTGQTVGCHCTKKAVQDGFRQLQSSIMHEEEPY